MTAQILHGTEITTGRRTPSSLVAEYDAKADALDAALEAFGQAQNAIKTACTIGGAFGHDRLETGLITKSDAQRVLLKSAWRHLYEYYKLPDIIPAADKRRIEMMFEKPPAFTVDNIRSEIGDYVADPWGTILRGLAEVFASLDPAFKSHEKVKIGVKGLPKRVILSNVLGYDTWGRDRLRDMLNALAAYQRKPLVEFAEIEALIKNGEALLKEWCEIDHRGKPRDYPARGIWLKRFQNGNGHLFFEPDTLEDVNRALAEYYGAVLPDAPDPNAKKQASTAVSKDLQYYPTPSAVVARIVADLGNIKGQRVLEPSCGCGRFLDALRRAGADCYGIEVDAGRVAQCRAKGHSVLRGNFLETVTVRRYDLVVMNPPFYGRHYAKHVRHALQCLKPGGKLVAILPVTARYDHGELDDLRPRWSDLPVGSFSESGTNINTTVCTVFA
jgi:methylase of polypeptide subunit release factors